MIAMPKHFGIFEVPRRFEMERHSVVAAHSDELGDLLQRLDIKQEQLTTRQARYSPRDRRQSTV